MPCSHCNNTGHNIRTCWRYAEFKREERREKRREKRREERMNSRLKSILDNNNNDNNNNDENDIVKKITKAWRQIQIDNMKLCDQLKEIKTKLDDKTKAFEDLLNVNQDLHQTSINNCQRSEKWAIQTVLTTTKFKLAMKTIQNKLIKNSAAEPNNDIFDCPVCMEKQTLGIQCDNNHKLCLNCSCSHLFTTNQSCPMCRDAYIKEDVREIAKEAGVKFSDNPNSNSITLIPIVPPIQFDGDVRRAIFESQQQ